MTTAKSLARNVSEVSQVDDIGCADPHENFSASANCWRSMVDDHELEARSSSWLRNRLYHDRARIFAPRTRARAMLGASVQFVSRIRASETRDVEARADFFDLLEQVERIARGLPPYEYVDGVGYVGRHGNAEESLRLISKAAALTHISPAQLDEATAKMAVLEDAALDEGLAFVAELRATTKPRAGHRHASHEPPAARGDAPRPSERPNYDDYRLREIAALLPDKVSWTDRAALSEMLLGELGDDVEPGAEISVRPVCSSAVLVVLLEHLTAWESRVEQAAMDKAIQLNTEYPHAQGTEREYLCRAADLDAELVQDAREQVAHLRRCLISAAVKVARIDDWPGDRRDTRISRARSLARKISRTMTFSPEDLAMAAASLGYGDASAS